MKSELLTYKRMFDTDLKESGNSKEQLIDLYRKAIQSRLGDPAWAVFAHTIHLDSELPELVERYKSGIKVAQDPLSKYTQDQVTENYERYVQERFGPRAWATFKALAGIQ